MTIQSRTSLLFMAVAIVGVSFADNFAAAKEKTPAATGLNIWKGVGGGMEAWSEKDGVLTCDGTHGKGHAKWIATKETYDDFDLSLEFNVAKDGNSGVFLRAPLEGNPAKAGMEVQLFDNDSPRYVNKPANYRTAAIWNVVAPSKDMHKKAGEWQSLRIVCVGRHCKIWHNGEQVIDVNLDDHKDLAETQPGILRTGGHLGLQNHGTPFAFRNIQIKRIDKKSE